MKKNYVILSVFLILVIVVIIISVYTSKQSLKDISEIEEKSQVIEGVTGESPIFIEQKEEFVEKDISKTQPEALEFDLEQIPDEYFDKSVKEKEFKEELDSNEIKLNKQPAPRKLRELKIKRVIIY